MKIRAFLQALFLVACLVGSWFLLFNRLKQDDPAEVTWKNPVGVPKNEGVDPAQSLPTPAEDNPANEPVENPSPPESWAEWITYLESVDSPNAMRAALAELSDMIFALPRGEAIAVIVDFLNSGADLRTGLAFQPGPENSLQGTNSLRAFLLDLLQQLDPQLAAEWAVDELDRQGTALGPDVYAVHMRNFARGTNESGEVVTAFLNKHFAAALANSDWTDNPTTAVAELMDIAVYTRATGFLQQLSELIEIGDQQLLRRAASLAIERVYGIGGSVDAVCTATALSQGSQCDQSSYPACSVCSISMPRKPVQSTNRSPATSSPESIVSDLIYPESSSVLTLTILPSILRTPHSSLRTRRNLAYAVASM